MPSNGIAEWKYDDGGGRCVVTSPKSASWISMMESRERGAEEAGLCAYLSSDAKNWLKIR